MGSYRRIVRGVILFDLYFRKVMTEVGGNCIGIRDISRVFGEGRVSEGIW